MAGGVLFGGFALAFGQLPGPEQVSTVTCLVEVTDWQLVDLPPLDCAPTGRIVSLASLGPAASTAALAMIGAGLVLGLAMAASLYGEASLLRARAAALSADPQADGAGEPGPPPYGGRRGAGMARFGRTRGREAGGRADPRRAWSGRE